jgi:hypothetical protein
MLFSKREYEVDTYCRTFRLDFYLQQGPVRIAIECDGREFHSRQDQWKRDLARDTLILGSGAVETIFRVEGKNIFHNLPDSLHLIGKYYPRLFTERGRQNLECLSSPTTRVVEIDTRMPFLELHYPLRPEDEGYCEAEAENESEKDFPWRIWLEAHSLWNTSYYHFKFGTLWEIVRFREARSFDEIVPLFRDVPKLVDDYRDMVRAMSQSERQAHYCRLEAVQRRLYGATS